MSAARAALVLSIVALAFGAGAFFEERSAAPPAAKPDGPANEPASYAPGLGEIMTAIQMRHAKLGIAGAAGNWELADYELDELDEGLDDALTFHPMHKDIRQPLTELVPTFMKAPIDGMREAVKAKDAEKFNAAFNSLTTGCNSCHQATDFGFNVVTRPTSAPMPNQQFEPAR